MVMPLWDENPFTKPVKPLVTWLIIAANIVVFFIEVAADEEKTSALIKTYALTPIALTQPTSFFASLPADLTLATYMFLHADATHLFFKRADHRAHRRRARDSVKGLLHEQAEGEGSHNADSVELQSTPFGAHERIG